MKKVIFAAMAAVCLSANANFRDGNKLLEELKSDVHFSVGLASGYIIGVVDAGDGVNHCVPANVTAGQIRDMIKNHLENNPVIRHFSADLSIYYVLKNTWPCNKKKGSSL